MSRSLDAAWGFPYDAYGATAEAVYIAIEAVYAAIDRRDLAAVHFALADARIALGAEADYDDAYQAARETAVLAATGVLYRDYHDFDYQDFDYDAYGYDAYDSFDYEAEAEAAQVLAEEAEEARREYYDGTPDGFEAVWDSEFYDYFGYHSYD